MGNRDLVFASLSENKQIISTSNTDARAVFAKRGVEKIFEHEFVSDCERLFPNVEAIGIVEADLFVECDNLSREVHLMIAAGIARGNIGAMNSRNASRRCESVDFSHHIFIVLKELLRCAAVRQVFNA